MARTQKNVSAPDLRSRQASYILDRLIAERRVSPGDVHFFFNDTATTEIYTLSLHDALPNFALFVLLLLSGANVPLSELPGFAAAAGEDRKSTRLNPVTIRSRMPSSA